MGIIDVVVVVVRISIIDVLLLSISILWFLAAQQPKYLTDYVCSFSLVISEVRKEFCGSDFCFVFQNDHVETMLSF